MRTGTFPRAARTVVLAAIFFAFIAWFSLARLPETRDRRADVNDQAERTSDQESVDKASPSALRSRERPVGIPSATAAKFDAYATGSLLELDRLANRTGSRNSFDYAAVRLEADSLCNALPGLAIKGKGNYAEFLKLWKGEDKVGREALASAALVDAFRSKYCSYGLDQPAQFPDRLRAEELELASAGYTPLLEARHRTNDSAEEIRKVRNELVEFMIHTDSPAAFRLAARTLFEDSPQGTSLGHGWLPPGASNLEVTFLDDHSPTWRYIAGELAFCGLSSQACAPNTLVTIKHCMPDNCRPGESLQAFLMRTQSPQSLAAAQAYARALLALRGGP